MISHELCFVLISDGRKPKEPSPLNLKTSLKNACSEVPRVFQFHSMQIPYTKDWNGNKHQPPAQINDVTAENTSFSLPVIASTSSAFTNQRLFYVATEKGLVLVPSFATAPTIDGSHYSVAVSQLTDQHGQFLFPYDEKSIAVTNSDSDVKRHDKDDDEAVSSNQNDRIKEMYKIASMSGYLNGSNALPQGMASGPVNLSIPTSSDIAAQEAPLICRCLQDLTLLVAGSLAVKEVGILKKYSISPHLGHLIHRFRVYMVTNAQSVVKPIVLRVT